MLTLNIDILSAMYKTRKSSEQPLILKQTLNNCFAKFEKNNNNVMLPDVKFHDLSFILNDKGSLQHCQFIFTFALRVFKRMVSQVLSEYQQKGEV